jgi:protein-S-isoprenylcysteine O-methyltransferase Ste14
MRAVITKMFSHGDFLGRMGISACCGLFLGSGTIRAVDQIASWQAGSPKVMLLEFLANISGMLFQLLVIFITLHRLKPVNAAGGFEARMTAMTGTFLLLLIPVLPYTPLQSPTLQVLGLVMFAAGSLLSAYVIFWLGKSFSIMAEARRLVTSGPYSFVRHPLYVSEEIAVFGALLLNLSLPVLALVFVHFLTQLRRIHHEEKVLRATFPEYSAYARATPMLVPGSK